jgi:hypothetical protein
MYMYAQISYAVFCVFFAWRNAVKIGRNQRILHGVNGYIHFSICSGIALSSGSWVLGLSYLLVGRIFFDWSLDLFRGLPLNYVSLNPKSILDRLEKRLFGINGLAPKVVYAVLVIILDLIYLKIIPL